MFGRLQLYIFIGIISFGILSTLYYNWRASIEREALLEYNQAQLEQSIKDKEEMQKQLESIDAKRKEIEAENAKDKQIFRSQLESLGNTLNSKEVAAEDRPASKVLKETVNKLKDVVK